MKPMVHSSRVPEKKAVVLISGGLDSATCLVWALKKKYKCFGLFFDYGQRHLKEFKSAENLCRKFKIELKKIKPDLPWLSQSSLVNKKIKLPNKKLSEIKNTIIPSTYVAARNLIMISIAASFADTLKADNIIIGANAIDYSGYPDCRPAFIKAVQKAVKTGTRIKKPKILTPLIKLTKAGIVKLAVKLSVPLELTWSCYKGGKTVCGICDSCKLRAEGFKKAKVKDPLVTE